MSKYTTKYLIAEWREIIERQQAEYAALAAAHDAAMAEAERRQAAALHLLRDIDDSLVALTRGYQPTGNAERRNAAYLALCNHVARKAINAAILLGWQRPEPGYDLAEQLAEALARAEAAEAQIAAAREDGARSMAEWSDEPDHDYSFCKRGKGGWLPIPGEQALAAWQAQQTKSTGVSNDA